MGTTIDRPMSRASVERVWLTPVSALLFLVAAASWAAMAEHVRSMGKMSGSMGMSLSAFVAMWSVMTAAMMFPSLAPLASRYVRMLRLRRWLGFVSFALGYLAVWGASGGVAFLLTWEVGRLTALDNATVAASIAAGTFALCGLYQLSPLKYRCLRRCRAPFSLLLEYASWRGPLVPFRVGAHHGAYCLGCCWALMLLMLVFGIMNIGAMVVLSVVIALEKTRASGETLPRVVGFACLVLAVAVFWFPGLYPGLDVR
jgi:predicted metal-binding membrane protein